MDNNIDLADILRRAAALIEPEGAWTQGAFSRNADGSIDMCGEDDEPDGRAANPTCWCALGAIAHAAGYDLARKSFPLEGPLKDASKALGDVVGMPVDDWNDALGRRQVEVVAKLREAAKAIEARSDETQGSAPGESAARQGSPESADHE